jgi:ribonuclease HI
LANKISGCEILSDAWIESTHRCIKTTLSFTDVAERHFKPALKPHRVKLDMVTPNQWKAFHDSIEENSHISKISQKYANDRGSQSHFQLVGHLHQLCNTMRNVAKKTLPYYNPNLPLKRKNRMLPLNVIKDLNLILKISSYLKFGEPLSESNRNDLESLRSKLEIPVNESTADLVKEIKKCIKRNIHKLTQQSIKEACAKKEATFLENIKKNISHIFDKGSIATIDFWKTDDDEIITDQEEFLEYAHNHYQNKLFKIEQDTPLTLATLPTNWKQEYSPKHEIESYWYDELRAPLTMEKMKNLIKCLPHKKAAGPSQISNEMIKHLGPKSRVILLAILNSMLKTNKIPQMLLKNLMILIPKESEFSGNISKTRPIALQETIKKLLSVHITNALSSIVERHQILKGFNSGFTANESTKDVIISIKNIIDISNQTKHPLFIASLDIKGAYDTVKKTSIKLALQRIKVPTKTIELILNLEMERSITLITSKGSTMEIHPDQSLPQGSPAAPILWKIHMDPLLTHLASLEQGFPLVPNLDVGTCAFADDSYLITDEPEKLQKLLDCTDDFLSIHDQQLSAQKSTILRNPAAEKLEDFDFTLKSSNSSITNMPSSKSLHRFLGCFLAMDSNAATTVADTKTKLDGLLHFVRKKFNPGYITVYLVKTVIIPLILYRLQATPVCKSAAQIIDRKINKLLKQKYKIPMQTPTFVLRHPEILNIPSIQSQLEKNLVSTSLEMISQPQKHAANIFHACIKRWQKIYGLQYSPLYAPLETAGKNRFLIPHISSALYKLDISLRQLPSIKAPQDASIVDVLSHKDFARYHQDFALLKVRTVKDMVATNTNTVMSFSAYQARLPHALLERLTATGPIPLSYKLLVSNLSGIPQAQIDWTSSFPLKPEFAQRSLVRRHAPLALPNTTCTPFKNAPLNPTIEPLNLIMYTDGSLQRQNSNMGAACIIRAVNGTETILQTPLNGLRNSTRPELVAIMDGIASCPSNANITVFTDSQTSIHTLERLLASKILPFKLAHKYSNSSIIRNLHHILNQRDGITKCIKVAAHTGIVLNERVDKLAKAAVSLTYSTALYNYMPNTPQALTYVFHNKWMYDMNPKSIVRKLYDQCHIASFKNHISSKLKNDENNVDMKLTCRILSSRVFGQRTLPLKETTFRMKLFCNILPLNSRISKKSKTQYCLRCTKKAIETLDHFLECEDNQFIEEEIQMKAIEIMHDHLDGSPLHGNLIAILNKCQLLQRGCLRNPISKGVITNTLKKQIKKALKLTSHDCNILMALIVDAWLHPYKKLRGDDAML